MRSLLVCAAPFECPAGWLADLASTHDVLIAVDGGTAHCVRAGLLPDVVVGDMDSLRAEDEAVLSDPSVTIERFPVDKDLTDLDLALDFARRQGVREVTVVAAFSGRLDHTLAAVGSISRAGDLWPRIESPELRGWILTPSARGSVQLTGVGSTVSVLAVNSSATVSIHGSRWDLEQTEIASLDAWGLSNTIVAEVMGIECLSGTVLVIATPPADSGLPLEIG
jgi:thiamine pyrophosphokinase